MPRNRFMTMVTYGTLLVGMLWSTVGTATSQKQPQKFTIGLAGNFSNLADNASHPYGPAFIRAAQMAVDDLTPDLSKAGLSVQLETFDYGSAADQVISAAERAVKSDAIGVLGFIYSSHVLIAAETFQKNHMLLLTPTATADRIDTLGPYVRRSCFSDSLQGSLLAQGAVAQGVKTVAITAASDCAYCLSLKTAFVKEFSKLGGKVVADIPVLTTDTDYSAVFSALKLQPADAVLVPNYETPSSLLVADLIKRGFNPRFWLGGDAWNANGELSTKILKGAGAQALIIAQWQPFAPSPRAKSFIERFTKKFGQSPVDAAALAYDGMTVMIRALILDKVRTRESLVNAIGRVGKIRGVTGTMTFAMDQVTPTKAANLLLLDGDVKKPIVLVGPKKIK